MIFFVANSLYTFVFISYKMLLFLGKNKNIFAVQICHKSLCDCHINYSLLINKKPSNYLFVGPGVQRTLRLSSREYPLMSCP